MPTRTRRSDLTRRDFLKYSGGGLMVAGAAGCGAWQLTSRASGQDVQEPLDPLTIPKYVHELPIPRVFAPSIVRDASGRVVRHDYTVSQDVVRAQVLPAPDFPQTTVMAFGGRVRVPGSNRTETVFTSPG